MANVEENEVMDILGFSADDLDINKPQEAQSFGNPNIYKPKPANSKSEDGIYRAQIKIVYNPFNLKRSVIEQQSYGLQDANGFFSVVSSLTNNDKNCPVFKAWKQCHFSQDPAMQAQALTKDKGGRGLFDKRYARYVLIQVIDDPNAPELNGKYMVWKAPKAIWEMINSKQSPTNPSKAAIPVMDFLFGRAIDLEITPGPDDKAHPERKTREISYATSEITEDIVSVINPDGTPILSTDEQEILDTYVDEMTKKVWKQKDPDMRKVAQAEIDASDNTKALRKLYVTVLGKIKEVAVNLEDEIGYKEWSPEVTTRVQNWINIVLSGGDPATPMPGTGSAVGTPNVSTQEAPTEAPVAAEEPSEDLPF